MDVPALELCVGDVDTFFADHWDRAPLLRQAVGGPDSFGALASLGVLDEMVSSLGLTSAHLRMVRDGKTLPASSYTTPGPGRQPIPLVSPALVYERYAEGATIVLESLHRYRPALADFCRELEVQLGHRLQVNAYITPPGSQGFGVHTDDHDVFVLQVSGAKHWTVLDRDEPDVVLIDEPLEPGACLYIPAGFPHSAATQDVASAHLTVGILTHAGTAIVREVLKLAEEEPSFKARLDLQRSDPHTLQGLVQSVLDDLGRWLEKVDAADVTQRVARRLLSTSQPIVRGQLQQLGRLDALGLASPVRRRPGTTCAVLPTEHSLRVLLSDRELDMPFELEAAIAEIARLDRFTPGDLSAYLDEASALVLVRRLIREGLLEAVIDD